jgi:hypothetical protein
MELVSIIVAGAAGAFMKSLTENGVTWLIEMVAAHSPAVQAQTQANMQRFLGVLAKRVERLEATMDAAGSSVFEEALSHPSSSLLMQHAMDTAAATDSVDRHALLAELIAQRLTAGADDMISLAGAAACDVVGALTSRQIRLLGLMAKVLKIRPSRAPEVQNETEYALYLATWWVGLDHLLVGVRGATNLDFEHPAALSCVRVSIGSHDLAKTLALPVRPKPLTVPMNAFESLGSWAEFKALWDSSLQHCYLTSIGQLVGTLSHDRFSRTHTYINW